jgi:hypothetical protein
MPDMGEKAMKIATGWDATGTEDPEFKALVATMEQLMAQGRLTPEDIRDACSLAIDHYQRICTFQALGLID